MRISRNGLELLSRRHAIELRFRRRHEKPGWKDHRRMLCTKDWMLLTSKAGRGILNFVPPHGVLPYNPAAHNLVILFDIFKQEWRAVGCEEVEVISVIKTTPPETFWEYFNHFLLKMTPQEKLSFMNA